MNAHQPESIATDDGLFEDFLEQYEPAADRAAVLSEFCRQWPARAERLQALAARTDQLRAMAAAAAPHHLPAGQVLGPFCVVRELATGGMGVIYEARQAGLERRVALKTIRADRASPEARERFVREQQALALLHHTHIVPVFASGEDGGLQYYGMQFIEGVTLHTLIQRLRSGASFPTPVDFAAVLAPRSIGAVLDAPDLSTRDLTTLPTKFPTSYFRFAASIVAQAAEAVHSAHERQVIHRDLKPANLLLDDQAKCWLIDFGLARLPRGIGVPPVREAHQSDSPVVCGSPALTTVGRGSPDPALHPGRPADGELARSAGPAGTPADAAPLSAECAAMTQQALGTQPYMSPEHFQLRADERSDIWSLGAILYELLTLRRAFPGQSLEDSRRLIEANRPTPADRHVKNVPRTLVAIFQKSTRSNPAERYASPAALAQDLRNWLDHKPTSARRVPLLESVGLWARRSPGRAWASGAAVILAIAAVSAIMLALSAAARLQSARADSATERASLAEQGQRAQQREIMLRDLVELRLGEHRSGWREQANRRIDQIAELGVDESLQTQAASCLQGLDAHVVLGFRDVLAWYVALSPDERWMLTGGPKPGIPTRLVELKTQQITTSQLDRPSLVYFTPDNTPLQLGLPTADDPRFVMWDVAAQQRLGELAPPRGWTTDGLVSAVSRDNTHLAIAGRRDGEPVILVWNLTDGTLAGECNAEATAVTLSANGELLAVGNAAGNIEIRQLPSLGVVRQFVADRGRIVALDMNKSPLCPRANPQPEWRYYLAVAAMGGSLAVWDLESLTTVNYFRGSPHGLHAVALSPDSATLVSGGRNWPQAWDTATGRLLLRAIDPLPHDWHRSLCFSRGGSHFAVASSDEGVGDSRGGAVWRLEDGAGVRTLRGLGAPVSKTWLSSDDTLVAGLTHTWQLGVWDVPSGALLHVFETPQGHYADNAAAVFSADNQRLAFATQGEACLWDLRNQQVISRWPVSKGFCDDLAFTPSGDLILFRADGQPGSFVGRAYRLDIGREPQVLMEYQGCREKVHHAALSPHGDWVVVDGWATKELSSRTVTALDVATGDTRWSHAGQLHLDDGRLTRSRDGRLLMSYGVLPVHQAAVLEGETGKFLRAPEQMMSIYWLSSQGAIAFSQESRLIWMTQRPEMSNQQLDRRLFTIDMGIDHAGMARAEFTRDDRYIAWGGPTGEVLIADVERITQFLSERLAAYK